MTYKGRPISVAPVDVRLCGIGSLRPKWIQGLATTKMFMFIFGMIGILQGAAFTYMIGSITTLEKRYAFGSKITGLILITDNFVAIIFNPLFGYLASHMHRPRLIGYCQIVVIIGCFLAALPYFIYGPAFHMLTTDHHSSSLVKSNKTYEFCDSNQRPDSECLDVNGSNTVIPAVVILCLATCCNGIGFVAFYTIGFPFIDDNVKKKNSPLYISTTAALRLLGPTLGFMLSAICLRFYENPFFDPGIDRLDPRWIGAWWLGFVIIGLGTLIFTIPMFLFPRSFKIMAAEVQNQMNNKPLLKENKSSPKYNETIWKRVLKLAKNPIYMCYVVGTNIRLFAVIGYLSFQSKYIETEYKNTASFANLITGLVDVVPSAFGIFLGGFLISKLQPKPKVLTTFITLVEICGAMGYLSALFLGCPANQFAGTNGEFNYDMQTMCNDNCFCTEKVFQPICGSDNRTHYFSPCFAGCKASSLVQLDNQKNRYNDCNCFTGSATEGYCPKECNKFFFYVTFLGIANLIGSLAKTGNTIISFRIVDERDKTFAIGLMGAFMCIFAFIPGPLVYGVITDAACLIWEESCGQRGNCWVYDSTKFKNYLHGLTLALYFSGSIFDIIVIFLSKRIKNLYNDPIAESPVNLKLSSSVDDVLALESQL